MNKIKTILNSHPKTLSQAMMKMFLIATYAFALSYVIEKGMKLKW